MTITKEKRYPRVLCNPVIVAEHACIAFEKAGVGSVLDAGVFDGVSSAMVRYVLQLCAAGQQFRYFACDTYEGFPYDGTDQEQYKHGELGAFPGVPAELSRIGITPLVGMVERTLPRIAGERFAFVFLDLDLEHPTRFAWRFVRDRLLPGGRIGFHDWNPDEPSYRLSGISTVVKEILATGQWVEVFRRHGRPDGRFIFLEKKL